MAAPTASERPEASATQRLRRRYALRGVLGRAGVYVVAVLAALACAGPFVWSTLTATKLNADLYNPQHNPFV